MPRLTAESVYLYLVEVDLFVRLLHLLVGRLHRVDGRDGIS